MYCPLINDTPIDHTFLTLSDAPPQMRGERKELIIYELVIQSQISVTVAGGSSRWNTPPSSISGANINQDLAERDQKACGEEGEQYMEMREVVGHLSAPTGNLWPTPVFPERDSPILNSNLAVIEKRLYI